MAHEQHGAKHAVSDEWLRGVAERGLELSYEGEQLRFRAPKGALTPELRAELSANRREIIARLRETARRGARDLPLSFSQQALWFLRQQVGDSMAYQVAMAVRVLSTVDSGALRQAFQAIVDRHASLRTTYPLTADGPCQRIAGESTVAFDVRDARGLGDAELRKTVEAEYARPFDLENGPVFRGTLFTRQPDEHVLLITVHHIAADGWSLVIVFEELLKLYAEAAGAGPAGLPRPTLQFADCAASQERLVSGPDGERLMRYWTEKLAPPRALLELPADRPRPAVSTFKGASWPLKLDPNVTKRIKELARGENTTSFVVLLAAFHALLFRLTGTEDITVGTPTLGRSKADFMRVVGNFANPVPLRARLGGDETFRGLLAELRRSVSEALDAQEYPFSLLVRRLQPERIASRSPFFDAFFALQLLDQSAALQKMMVGSESEIVESAGLRLGSYVLPLQEGRFDLALEVTEHEGVILGAFKYATDLFDESTIRSFADGYVALLDAVLADPSSTLAALPPKVAAKKSGPDAEMTALFEQLQQKDIRLFLENDKLRVNAPKGVLTDDLKAAIGARRDAIIAALRERESALPGLVGLRAVPRTESLPLSSVQQRLWFLDRMQPGQSQYNVSITVRMRGRLDANVLRRAVDLLTERHETLRTRIIDRDGTPEAEILQRAVASLEIVDVSDVRAAEREAEGLRRCIEHIETPFELGRKLAAFRLVRVSEGEHFFSIAMHHAISDGWSMVVALREVCQIYASLAEKRAPALPSLTLQYVDYSAWERDQLHSGRMARHLAFWKEQLAGAAAVLELPTDRPRPAVPTFHGKHAQHNLGLPLLEELRQLGRRHDATLYMTLLAAWQVLLHRYSGQDDIVVGSPIANREHPALENLVGCFVNNVVVRGQLADNPRFVDFLRQIRERSLSAFEHATLPFDVLVNGLGQARSANHSPVFQVLFTLHSFPFDCPPPPGLEVKIVDEIAPDTARFDLGIDIAVYDGKFVCQYEYATDLFDSETITRMHGHFGTLLAAVVKSPELRVKDLPLVTSDDTRLLDGWNATSAEHDRGRCVHHLLETSARRTPDATAAIAGETKLTYRELDEAANRLARLLVERGVTPGSLVAVCVDRTLDMPIAIAAVLKAGAAYVPLDPTHPAERLRYTLEDAGVACAITLERFAPLLAEAHAPLILLDTSAPELARLPLTAPNVTVKPNDRAYVIYTSGSTGRPKGVEVEHRNVVAFLEAMQREPGLLAADTLLAVTTLSFDIAGLELWLPLSVGARVVIASRTDVIDGEKLMALLTEHAVTVMQATPATWRLMLEAGWSGKYDLKVLCGGEALPRDLAASLLARVSELWNMYGPTETTIWSTVSRIVDASAPITVGHPIHNTTVYVLEPSGQIAPVGVPGELCIGGEGVARGYHDRPELTAEKFVTITLPNGTSARVYRTGDLARFRADGRIDFLGRRDHQVKVRGYRIELGEIEAVLATHPGVKETVVSARETSPGDQRLIGYVVLAEGVEFDAEAARTTLREKLPAYMIPNLFMVLPALPLTPNGKVDRKSLPAPDAATTETIDPMLEALMSPPQRRVAGVWRDVLNVDRVGLHDNFFDVGGHSLLLVKLHASLKREFGTEVSLVELFQWTTVAGQAARLSAAPAADDALLRAQARAAKQNHG